MTRSEISRDEGYSNKPTETEINSMLCQSSGIVSCVYYKTEICPMTCGLAEGQLEKSIEKKFESDQPKR